MCHKDSHPYQQDYKVTRSSELSDTDYIIIRPSDFYDIEEWEKMNEYQRLTALINVGRSEIESVSHYRVEFASEEDINDGFTDNLDELDR